MTARNLKIGFASLVLFLAYTGGLWPSFLHIAGFLLPVNPEEFPNAHYVGALATEMLFLGCLLGMVWFTPVGKDEFDPAMFGLWAGVVLSVLVNLRFAWGVVKPDALLTPDGLDVLLIALTGPFVAAIAAHVWISFSKRFPPEVVVAEEKQEPSTAPDDAEPSQRWRRWTLEEVKHAAAAGHFAGLTMAQVITTTGTPSATAYKHLTATSDGVVLKGELPTTNNQNGNGWEDGN